MKFKLLILGISAFILVFNGSCNSFENLTNSSSRMVIQSITGTGLDGTEGSATAFSDVSTENSIVNDNGTVVIAAMLLTPVDAESSYYHDITVDQIDVEYSRADGLNIEGKDVPFSFSQKVNSQVKIGEEIAIPFVIVTHNAKLESPLVDLVGLNVSGSGLQKPLKLEVKITVYARDNGNNRLAPVTGSMSVWCADFADPEEPEPEETT